MVLLDCFSATFQISNRDKEPRFFASFSALPSSVAKFVSGSLNRKPSLLVFQVTKYTKNDI